MKLKEKQRRKDIIRKRNAKKYAPKIVEENKKPIFAFTGEKDKNENLKLDERGSPLVKEVGEKIIKKKINKFTYADAKSKKFKLKKDNKLK